MILMAAEISLDKVMCSIMGFRSQMPVALTRFLLNIIAMEMAEDSRLLFIVMMREIVHHVVGMVHVQANKLSNNLRSNSSRQDVLKLTGEMILPGREQQLIKVHLLQTGAVPILY